jgi:HSP20 family protein
LRGGAALPHYSTISDKVYFVCHLHKFLKLFSYPEGRESEPTAYVSDRLKRLVRHRYKEGGAMSLINWQPLRELDILRQQVDRLFEDWMHSNPDLPHLLKSDGTAWKPAIELKETDSDIILKVQVPGIDADDLDIRVSPTEVSIAGEYQEEAEIEAAGVFRSEFRYGTCRRIIPLPVPVENERVTSEINNGILVLTLPKVKGMPRTVVKVNVGVQEQAREAMTQNRQHDEHIQATMHSRAAEAIQPTADL